MISIFKKIKFFRLYKKHLSINRGEILKNFNTKIDNAYRLYTVINIPISKDDEIYMIRKSDIDNLVKPYIKKYIAEISNYLNSISLNELFDIYEIKEIDKYSYLIVIGYSLFKSHKYYNILYYIITPVIVGMIISSFLIFL